MTQYEFEKQIIMFLEKFALAFKFMMRFLIIIFLILLLWFGNNILTIEDNLQAPPIRPCLNSAQLKT